ncbi:hypothetical protein LAUMK13_00585 [Mycobacterium innocens]|uniref:Uncharacterized protein n=1 Tax=Mycobacterium innocens TaxID=2341083 RepID=A0A498PR87_9MYCO|nr:MULTISPECIES: hypothetical protein [Mycobacterium]VBA34817.1 hypothetical protein LAUMK13_00585 [Mycobacterium innocens]
MVAGTRARVEHLAADAAKGDQLLDDRLRAADVPRDQSVGQFRIAVQRLETGNVGLGCHGILASLSTGERTSALYTMSFTKIPP